MNEPEFVVQALPKVTFTTKQITYTECKVLAASSNYCWNVNAAERTVRIVELQFIVTSVTIISFTQKCLYGQFVFKVTIKQTV